MVVQVLANDELVSSFCDSYDPIPKSEIYKVLGKLKNFEIFNSGIEKQSYSQIQLVENRL